MGRPIIITEELKEGIRKDRASGMGATKIARKYGIGVSTVYAHSQNLAPWNNFVNESITPYTIGHHRVYSYKPIDSWWCSRVLSGN